MQGMPGTADDIMIFYGQSKSFISFIIETFGEKSITELMATIKSGKNAETSFKIVYDISLLEAENLWRNSVGAPEYNLLDKEKLLPTPIPISTIAPYTVANLSKSGQSTQLDNSTEVVNEKIQEEPQQLTSPGCNPSKSSNGLNSMELPILLIVGLIPLARKRLKLKNRSSEKPLL